MFSWLVGRKFILTHVLHDEYLCMSIIWGHATQCKFVSNICWTIVCPHLFKEHWKLVKIRARLSLSSAQQEPKYDQTAYVECLLKMDGHSSCFLMILFLVLICIEMFGIWCLFINGVMHVRLMLEHCTWHCIKTCYTQNGEGTAQDLVPVSWDFV